MSDNQHSTIYRKDYQVPVFLISELFLDFKLGENDSVVKAKSMFHRNPESAENCEDIVLNGENLELLSISVNGKELLPDQYNLDEKSLVLQQVPDEFVLEVTTRIYPDKNSALEGLYRSSGNFCTQCEAEGFRKITYFLDRPDVMTRFTTRIEADKADCPVLLSNGNLVEEGVLDKGRHFTVWKDPFPKSCYLFALVAGDLVFHRDEFITKSGRSIDLRIYVEARNREKCAHAMASLKKSMAWDEKVFGLEYDLDRYMIVAVDDFNMGAMENKGLNIFNSKYVLASQETATDQDYLGVEGVIAHEYFHNWTGNRVTCRDWFQLSLKEGLTVFRDQEFSSDMNSRAVQRIEDVRILRNFQFREDSGPMAHPVRPDSYVEINNFYTVTVYNKGAEVIHMMHTLLGSENFRKGMDLYFERHDGQAVTCDDFVAAMASASGVDLDHFKLWYSQSGTPELEVEENWDENAKQYSLHITQSCPPTPGQAKKEPFHIPIAFGLLDSAGQDMDSGKSMLELHTERESFIFKDLPEKPVLSMLRGFSAPVKVKPWQGREQLAFLMANDSDPFNRWDAAFRLSESVILEITEKLQQGEHPVVDPLFIDAVREILNDKKSDKSLLGMALTLPGETYLAQQMEVIDPDNLHCARETVRFELSTTLAGEFRTVLEENRDTGEYQLTPEAMGKRRLKNVCQSFLLTGDSPASSDVKTALVQYHDSGNMTDVMAVLAAISNCAIPERQELIDDFYEKWKTDPLVMDKWLILQAASSLPQTLDSVLELMHHPAFSISNPNKVRSLIGAFGSNHVCFHNKNGAGYEFLANQILVLDSTNPQIASRLTTPFATWKRYDENRQELMKEQLQRIMNKKDLSGDVYEMVKRSLKG
ncbi:MAG TPA: aminopeptidase N [Desulfobacterales bacterium]|nr:aminopeptidase N [Desulfobacterales bacterium]HIP38487.1 aminopeptidase N [Desulfocapsa sulfexigens]